MPLRPVSSDPAESPLTDWVAKLDEEDQKLFVFCGLEGLSYVEISERTQVHKDTIAKRWQNLRARLGQFALPRDLLAAE